MAELDKWTERMFRGLARRTSRRNMFTLIGGAVTGAAAIPLLPVARASASTNSYGLTPETTGNVQDPGDPTTCEYWRYCAIDGFLCSCCGGTVNACPPGTEMSPITWIGTCHNPADNRNYIISYNDCCGKSSCGRCVCNRNEGDRPVVRPQSNNDIDWCLGTASSVYNCSTAVLIGVALGQDK
ncbi:methylamine dehydrogenase (amicyanin) light chain [Alphaproteobacteria bacterium LMG 31809]|uniref:Methylamine dehydrogenase (amicyanin) n=1 Tax=Govanella unica TaxID=2975056 RepID=A0A9X3U121_9PROT|nr:methylamine dehydrogenase (amicyanin) light chain [Govania unica]